MSDSAAQGELPMRPRRERRSGRDRDGAAAATATADPTAAPTAGAGGSSTGSGQSRLSRRNVLTVAASAAVVATGTGKLLLAGSEHTLTTVGKLPAATSGTPALNNAAAAPATASLTSAQFTLSKHLDPHLLLRRVSYGRTPAMEHDLHRLGPTAWLTHQLKPATIKDPGGAAVSALYPRLAWSVKTAHAKLKNGDWALMQDTVAAHLGRAIFSSRQLNEVMVDFWANHLNVTCPSSDVWDTRHRYQYDVLRHHALGSFEAMLQASAVHPAMLMYLNGNQSTGQAPNENYSRELLELHTVGVDGGYTERDVQRGALLLTGWTTMDGAARFDPQRHHVGAVRAFGFHSANSTAAGGPKAQRAYLKYLAHHPKTAHRIALKLAQRFVSDSPPKSLVSHLAASYRKHGTQVVPVLRDLFSSREFAESAGEKVRRPMEVVVASARVIGVKLGHNPKGLSDLAYTLNDMGQVPLGWPMPNGYPDVAASWQSPASALAQFNQGASMVQGWWPTALGLPGPKKLLSPAPQTRSAVITAVAKKVLGRAPTSRERSAANTLLAGTTLPASFGAGSYQQQQTVALTTTLFLSSPAHLTR